MAVPRSRLSHQRTNIRRAHHAKKPVMGINCPNCGARSIPHVACQSCGFYKGREVVEVRQKSKEENS